MSQEEFAGARELFVGFFSRVYLTEEFAGTDAFLASSSPDEMVAALYEFLSCKVKEFAEDLPSSAQEIKTGVGYRLRQEFIQTREIINSLDSLMRFLSGSYEPEKLGILDALSWTLLGSDLVRIAETENDPDLADAVEKAPARISLLVRNSKLEPWAKTFAPRLLELS